MSQIIGIALDAASDDVPGELGGAGADRHLDEAGHAGGGAGHLRTDADRAGDALGSSSPLPKPMMSCGRKIVIMSQPGKAT